MIFDADDPRLTAYTLDELDPADRAEIEKLLEENPDARKHRGGDSARPRNGFPRGLKRKASSSPPRLSPTIG